MKVLSLFDGIGGAARALAINGVWPDTYLSSETDPECNALLDRTPWVDAKHLGPVEGVGRKRGVDLLIGGSPCQQFSLANTSGRVGLAGDRGKLVYEFMRVLDLCNPKHFLLENVGSMSEEVKEAISGRLGVPCVTVDASAFSAQRRVRHYWTSIPQEATGDACPRVLGNVVETPGPEELPELLPPPKLLRAYDFVPDGGNWKDLPERHPERRKIEEARRRYEEETGKNPGGQTGFWRVFSMKEKAPTLTASGIRQKMTRFVFRERGAIRYPSRGEVAALQGFPRDHLRGLPLGTAYRMAGNSFQCDTVARLLLPIC